MNPLYLIIDEVDGYLEYNSIEEKNGNRYLIFDSTNKDKEVLKKYAQLCYGIKNVIVKINGGKLCEYGKEFMKIKFNSDDNLPWNKTIKVHNMTIIIRSVFEKDGKFYLQIYLDEWLYEL